MLKTSILHDCVHSVSHLQSELWERAGETYLEANKAISELPWPPRTAGLGPLAGSPSYVSIATLLSAETTEAISHLITETYSFQTVLSTKRNYWQSAKRPT